MVQGSNEQNEEWWGARINDTDQHRVKDYPTWANGMQQRKWTEQGLILWDHRSHTVTRLYATQAFQLLEELRGTDEWRDHGITVGEPVTRLFIGKPKREPEEVLVDQIALDPSQSQTLFDLLAQNEARLKQMAEAEEQECDRALADAYRYILQLAHRRKQRQQSDASRQDS